ncbi:MAG: hypothetical protein O3A01_02215 [bacterium]|nr:hypothetical protein [bacterium]
MLIKTRRLAILILILCASPVFGETEPFFPDHTRRLSGVSWGDKPFSAVENLFHNPATLATNKSWQFHVSHGQYAFDYSSLTVGLVIPPIWGTTIGFAFDHYASDTIPEVKHNGYRPYKAGEFADTYQTARLSLAHPITKKLYAGAVLDMKGRQIKEIGATGGSVDVGLAWEAHRLANIGLHTRNMMQSPLNWSTGHTETFSPSTVVEFNSNWKYGLTGLNIEFGEDGVKQHSVGLETLFADTLGLFGRGFFEPEHGMTQYNIGVTLYASNFTKKENGDMRYFETQFKYVYQNFTKNDLADTQHLIVINLIYE